MANDGNNVEPTPQIEDVPSPKISGDQGGQSLSQAGSQSVDLSAFKEELLSDVKRELQSIKDTRLGKYGTRLDSIEETLAKYAAITGGSVDQKALDKIVADQTLADVQAELRELRQASDQPSAGTGERPWTERQASILEEAEIAKNDRRFVDFLRDNTFANHDEYIKALEGKAFEWKQSDAKKPQASTSTVAQTAPSLPVGDGTYTKEKYKTDMLAAWGNKEELKRIKAAARADGVDVDNIGFV